MKKTEGCFIKVKNDYLKFLNKEKIFGKSTADKITSLKRIYIPISFWIENKYKQKGKTLFLGFSGAQGSGKTTVTGILKIILKKFFNCLKNSPVFINVLYKSDNSKSPFSLSSSLCQT